jgi:transposase
VKQLDLEPRPEVVVGLQVGEQLGDPRIPQGQLSYLRGGATPTRAVAEHFHISRSAAAKQVARAREAGFLDRTTQGKTSGRRVADSATKEER